MKKGKGQTVEGIGRHVVADELVALAAWRWSKGGRGVASAVRVGIAIRNLWVEVLIAVIVARGHWIRCGAPDDGLGAVVIVKLTAAVVAEALNL